MAVAAALVGLILTGEERRSVVGKKLFLLMNIDSTLHTNVGSNRRKKIEEFSILIWYKLNDPPHRHAYTPNCLRFPANVRRLKLAYAYIC